MKLRRMIAVWAAKLTEKISVHIFHKQGVTWAGKIALRICPTILTDLAAQVKNDIFMVCGTNGKTTTNNTLCAALEAEGYRVVCNHTGSNMLNGVVAAFVLKAGWNGKLNADYACLEVDEASTRRVIPHFNPDYMITTNLFRDQLDRYGEIDAIANLFIQVMQAAPDMNVVVNGDDALTSYIAVSSGNKIIPYGINEKVLEGKESKEMHEGRFCRKCGAPLEYKFHHYSQLGNYACTACDFKRPEVLFNASEIEVGDQLKFKVGDKQIVANYKGFYNVYNILAVYAALKSCGAKMDHFDEVLLSYNPGNGRMESFEIDGTKILLNLAKNPAGFNQNIAAVLQDKTEKDLILQVNDKEQDGIDVSWLWDIDFDDLKDANIKSITVSGMRRYDLALRLKYVDIPCVVEDDIEKAIKDRVENGCKNLYVLVNFTPLMATRAAIKKLEEQK